MGPRHFSIDVFARSGSSWRRTPRWDLMDIPLAAFRDMLGEQCRKDLLRSTVSYKKDCCSRLRVKAQHSNLPGHPAGLALPCLQVFRFKFRYAEISKSSRGSFVNDSPPASVTRNVSLMT